MRSALPLLAAVALAPLGLAQTYKLKPVDSVSVNPAPRANVWRDNRHRAYNKPGSISARDVRGLLKFDLSKIPDGAKVVSMKLTCTLENRFGSPRNNPVVNLHHSADDKWTRATATGASGKLGVVLTANQRNFKLPKHTFPINVAAHNWANDLLDDRLTLAIDNTNPSYSYVYFYGSGGSPAGTPPVLEIVTTGGCGGVITTFGTGGKDGTGTTVTALSSGCPEIGKSIGLGAKLGSGNNVPMLVFVGGSTTSWLGIPLPADLTPFGAPNNKVYVSLDAQIGARAGSGTVSLAIPNDNTLKGRTFFAESVVVDRRANALGFVAGPGQRVQIAN